MKFKPEDFKTVDVEVVKQAGFEPEAYYAEIANAKIREWLDKANIDKSICDVCLKVIRDAGASVREASKESSDAVPGTTAIEENSKLFYHIE